MSSSSFGWFVLALCIALLTPMWLNYMREKDATIISKSWDKLISREPTSFQRIYVGINSCTDVITKGTILLNAMNVQPASAQDHLHLENLEHLQEAFHRSFAKGVASERFFRNGQLFKDLIRKASELNGTTWYVGGNAALIAQQIKTIFPHVQVELVGPVGPQLKKLLHPGIHISPYSEMEEDEPHLIMEFQVGETWGTSKAPVATRFITSHDQSNGEASYLETFFENLHTFNPDLIVLSGLHMLDGQLEGLWSQRILVLQKKLDDLSPKLPIHLELATMADVELMKAIIKDVIPRVTSLGLNEQELLFLAQVGFNKEITYVEQPPIEKVTEVIGMLFKALKTNPNSRLSRVHFHCLTYHIVAVNPKYWDNSECAVAAGAKMAGQRACDVDDMSQAIVELRIPPVLKLSPLQKLPLKFDPAEPVLTYQYEGVRFYFTPVLVCKQPVKVVGLGDTISATGLLISSYSAGV